MESTAEIKRLQSCINDLISVLALPAIWSGSESSQILGTLLDVLLTMLRLDFAYARLSDASDGPPIEVVRSGERRHSSVQPQQFGQALDRWLMGDQTTSQCVVPSPVGEDAVLMSQYDRPMNPPADLALKRCHAEDAAIVKQIIERATQDGKYLDSDYRWLMPDSSVAKHVDVVAQALSDDWVR